VSSCL